MVLSHIKCEVKQDKEGSFFETKQYDFNYGKENGFTAWMDTMAGLLII